MSIATGHGSLDEASLERGLDALVLDGVFSQALGVLTGGALLTGCALAYGASPSFVGMLAAIPFLAQLAQFPAVALIEKIRRRRLICLVSTIVARLMLLPLLAVPLIPDPAVARIVLLVAFALLTPLGAIGGCAWVSWTCDLVPHQRLGSVFARRQLRSNLSGMAAGILGGLIVDHWTLVSLAHQTSGYLGVFVLAILAAAASTWYLTRMPEVPMPPATRQSLGRLFAKPFRKGNFRRLMIFLGTWNLAVNLAVPFFTVYLVQDLHYRITTAIALGILSQLANAAALPLWGRISDRSSNKTVIQLCAPLFLACLLGWVVAAQPAAHGLTLPILFALQAVLGAATAGLDLAGGNIALKLAPREEATVYLGVNGMVKSLCAGLAPIAAGILADRMSALSCSIVLRWGANGPEFGVLQVQPWHVFFLAAAVLGALALTRLARVEEEGTLAPTELLRLLREALAVRLFRFSAE
jgi:MFS family permease